MTQSKLTDTSTTDVLSMKEQGTMALLLDVLPLRIQDALREIGRPSELIEVVMDLGRLPEARFTDGEVYLSTDEISADDVRNVIDKIGVFGADNRAGIERTLHRISAIRNRKGLVIGLTCRVGRAVYGVIEIIQDIVLSEKSILLLGRPGVGKTTLLREAARVLSDKKRVVIVDTSNEIAGDGDIPHPAIGRARRMQVAEPELQHEVMIEAVENHMPEAIVIDEIGRELETIAARTIAERGVQLIGTAHGNSLENLLLNPTLSDLVGGIDSVTLSDEEARRRGTQKTVLERKAPPTFDVLIEIQDRKRIIVHHEVGEAVDAILRGWTLSPEVRWIDENQTVHIETLANQGEKRMGNSGGRRDNSQRAANGDRRSGRKLARDVRPTVCHRAARGRSRSRKSLSVFIKSYARERVNSDLGRMEIGNSWWSPRHHLHNRPPNFVRQKASAEADWKGGSASCQVACQLYTILCDDWRLAKRIGG